MKHIVLLFKKSGSAAIILSLIVSASVLSTIFISQESANWFLSAQSQNIEEWENNFVAQTALAIGGYLVSNNLILCKEAGWKNYDANCKWNSQSSVNLSEFNLRSKTVLSVDGKKVLSFKGTVSEDVIDNPQSDAGDIDYRVTFDLVNWRETSVQNVIGAIPQSVCRDSSTMSMREGNCPLPKVNRCKDSNNVNIPDSVCEYISDNDQDYTIVLISVQVPYNTPVNTVYAGVRRPLSMPLVYIQPPGPICRLACAGAAATSLPECRGEFIPPSGENLSDVRIRVSNPGPGVVYSLSLLRRDTLLVDNSVKYKATGELLKQANKEMLLPGEHIIFQDYVDCQDSVSYTFSREATTIRRPFLDPGGIERVGMELYSDVNVHAQPFMNIAYGFFSLVEPVGACMVFDTVNSMMKSIDGTPACPNKYSEGQSCGKGGECYYSRIEPNRHYIADDDNSFLLQKTSTQKSATINVRYLVPH